MTFLFLYTELAGYFEACIKELSKQADAIHIVRQPVKTEAPFQFNFPENVTVYDRNSFSTEQLIKLAEKIAPDVIFGSGWVDKGYMEVCRRFKGKAPTVMGMDNHWFGTARQWVMRAAAPFTVHRSYSHVWVPGKPQKEYAAKLGFRSQHIREGFYCADVSLFAPEAVFRTEAKNYPHRFAYVGRYIPAKRLDLLFTAFAEVADEVDSDWELWCAGTGEEFDRRAIHPKIKHSGFLQPSELKEQLRHAGIFILPSHFEPWGVVVHEMAAAGFPLICSTAVGAASRFLLTGKNGYRFADGDKHKLKVMMTVTIQTHDDDLRRMALYSHHLGISYTTKEWAETAAGFRL